MLARAGWPLDEPSLVEDLAVETLFDDSLVVAVGRNNPLARRQTLTWTELADQPWVLTGRQLLVAARGHRPHLRPGNERDCETLRRDQGLLPGREHAVRAIALDDRYPWGHIALGYWAMMVRRTDESIAAFRRAVDLNPNSAAAHSHLSRGLAFAGRDRGAIEHGEEAIRLSPLDPEMALFLGAVAVAHYAAGRYSEAIERSLAAQRLRPGFPGSRRLLCASLAQAGRVDEARSLLATVQGEQPRLSIAWLEANVPYQTPELMERYLEGFRKAGLE